MLKWVALLIAATAVATPAQAQATLDPDHLITVLNDAGYPAENFSEEAEYRQILVSKPGTYQFLVELYECEEGKTCDTLEFFVGFPMEEAPTKAVLDAYSGPREGADISLDRRGAPRMVMTIDLPDEGLTDAQFVDQLKSWETMMAGFVSFLKGEPAAPAPAASADAAEAAAPEAADAG